MKIRLATFSLREEPSVAVLFNEYLNRLKHYCTIEVLALKSSTQKGEADTILKKISKRDELILLDEGGKEFTSKEFAVWLDKKLNASGNLFFVIGSAYGFHPSLLEKSSMKISLSRMTFPHLLAKVIFAEQLYRALTIIRNEKYHH
jgi:23S rRNA (pseudouridine1915-N3)-methyltransferase